MGISEFAPWGVGSGKRSVMQLYHEPRFPAARLVVGAVPSHADLNGANREHYVLRDIVSNCALSLFVSSVKAARIRFESGTLPGHSAALFQSLGVGAIVQYSEHPRQ